ncbi:TRAP transporter small permease [Allopusillimonas ginsengisoli]|uniref:TRAP transporter small permease n=1 Tax=Allopusillimonas ginsengisoli TaxID=453575 RepID=UPI0010C1A8EE|nr:TRAP transporter small permease [Allopusillimonas ginsengisoli]
MNESAEHPKRLAARLADHLFAVLTIVIALSLLLMLLLVFGNVVLRYLFNSGINISEEVARICFVWLTFSGAVLAFRARQHLAINMVISRMPPGMQKVVHILRQLVILWVLWLIIDGGSKQTVIGFSTITPVAGIPIAIFSGAVLFSAVAMALMTILDLYVAVRTPASPGNVRVFRTSVDSIDEVE